MSLPSGCAPALITGHMNRLPPIHPFPARMASDIVWDRLRSKGRPLRVLDPMIGSGTTLAAARLRGHRGLGYDRDPLAVLMARSWLSNVKARDIRKKAREVVKLARDRANKLATRDAYPSRADAETKEFIRYWFDITNRKHLAALSKTISRIRNRPVRDLMWCALSRLIIVKQSGVSLATDVSHSRPHKTYKKAPKIALCHFQNEVHR